MRFGKERKLGKNHHALRYGQAKSAKLTFRVTAPELVGANAAENSSENMFRLPKYGKYRRRVTVAHKPPAISVETMYLLFGLSQSSIAQRTNATGATIARK